MAGDFTVIWGELMGNMDRAQAAVPVMDDDDLASLLDAAESIVLAVEKEQAKRR